jgi:predicted NBD/HSP70 family sugar kinase
LVILAVDIGASSCKLMVRSKTAGEFRALDVIEHPQVQPNHRQLMEGLKAPIESVKATEIRVCVPGVVVDDVLQESQNLGWLNVNIATLFERSCGLRPSIVWSDARAAGTCARMEMRGSPHYIAFIWGTGLGGIIVKDDVLVQEQGLGHVDIPNGGPCGCGRTLCVEGRVGAIGLRRQMTSSKVPAVDMRGLSRLAKSGSSEAQAIITSLAEAFKEAYLYWSNRQFDGQAPALWLAGGPSLSLEFREALALQLPEVYCVWSPRGRYPAAAGLLIGE